MRACRHKDSSWRECADLAQAVAYFHFVCKAVCLSNSDGESDRYSDTTGDRDNASVVKSDGNSLGSTRSGVNAARIAGRVHFFYDLRGRERITDVAVRRGGREYHAEDRTVGCYERTP